METRSILNLPNQITIARLLIAVLLFVFLSLEIAGWGIGNRHLALNLAMGVFIVCVCTDWLDGWLARRFQQETVFGRLADPFVDKIVVCGAFIYLVQLAPGLIKPWFPVVMIGREFLVSGLRGYIESRGIPFGARWGGKIKMILQSVTIPVVLFYQANLAEETIDRVTTETTHAVSIESKLMSIAMWNESAQGFFFAASWLLIVATLLATALSAWDYVHLAVKALRIEKSGS